MKPEIDVNSPTWQAVSEAANDALGKAKDKTEEKSVAERDADFERGRIAALRAILKLAEPPKATPPITTKLPY